MGSNRGIVSPFKVVLVMLALSIAGVASIPLLNIEYLPEEKGRALTVSYSLPDASAEYVESKLTSRIEASVAGIKGVTDVESVSMKGSGAVTLTFRKGADIEKARFEVSSAIRSLARTFPEGTVYPVIQYKGLGKDSGVAVAYTLRGDVPPREIEQFANKTILPRLSALSNVDKVMISGTNPLQYVITFDAGKTAVAGISAGEIMEAVKTAVREEYIGIVKVDGGTAGLRVTGVVSHDFGSIPVKTAGGRLYRLKDIATWRQEDAPPSYYYRINGLNSIVISVIPVAGSNLIRTVKDVCRCMDEIERILPKEITAAVSYDASSYMRDELSKIFVRTFLCILILLLFALIISRSWRYSMTVSASLAVNSLSAFALYALFKLPIHIYTLAGISVSLGIVIDMTIVMADHYQRWHDRAVFPSLVTATATTIVAMMAVLLLPEKERTVLTDFIQVIIINLSLSLGISYLFIPSLTAFTAGPGDSLKQIPLKRSGMMMVRYSRYIKWSIKHKWLLLFVSGVVFGGSGWLFYKSLDKAVYYRQPVRPQLYIHAEMPEGRSIGQLNEVVKYIERRLAGYDGIETFTTRIVSADNAMITVSFLPEYENGSYPIMVKEDMLLLARESGGALWHISGLNNDFYNNDIASYNSAYRITLSGYRYQDLIRYAELAVNYIKERSRLVSRVEVWSAGARSRPSTEYSMRFDYMKMISAGINPYSVYDILNSRLWESRAGISNESGSPIIVRSSSQSSDEIWHLLNVPAPGESMQVKMSDFASIDKSVTDRKIYRHNQEYQVDVYFDYYGQVLQCRKMMEDVVNHLNDNVLPIGYKADSEILGLFNMHKERYYWVLWYSVIAILFVLAIAFNSIGLSIVVMLMIPLSLIGLFLVFSLFGINFDQGGFASVIMLCGIVVNASIYLIYAFKRAGGFVAGSETMRIRLYVRSFMRKAGPVALTVISTILGLLPFMSDGPSEPFWFDFAAGTIAGLLFSLIVLFFVLPPFVISVKQNNHNR